MKAELIANIIAAHCSGDEASFKTAVEALAADEDKKGNSRVSSMILDAYKGKNITLMKKPEVGQPAAVDLPCSPPEAVQPLPATKTASWSYTTSSTRTYRSPMWCCQRTKGNCSFRF